MRPEPRYPEFQLVLGMDYDANNNASDQQVLEANGYH
jgi:hypothetical protein